MLSDPELPDMARPRRRASQQAVCPSIGDHPRRLPEMRSLGYGSPDVVPHASFPSSSVQGASLIRTPKKGPLKYPNLHTTWKSYKT